MSDALPDELSDEAKAYLAVQFAELRRRFQPDKPRVYLGNCVTANIAMQRGGW